MRRDAAALACVGWLLGAAGAGAETWRLLDGTLTDAATGRHTALTGSFDAQLFSGGDPGAPGVVLLVDDFALRAGPRSFTPRGPIEYQGYPSSHVSLADAIHVDGDAVGFVRLHAGGILEADDEQVTFRTLEFRSGASSGGHAAGQLGDGPLPRRIDLEGVLYQVDQSFDLPGECLPFRNLLNPVNPQSPGNTSPGNGDRLILSYQVFDIASRETIMFVRPGGGRLDPPAVTIGDPSQIDGDLHEGGAVEMLNPFQYFPSLCNRLVPRTREESQIGTFSLVATAAQPVEIDVLPGKRHARVKPGSRDRLPVALLGASDLDVRDVVPSSLRLGPGDATPTGRAHRARVNHDRKPDLLVRFRTRDTEVAFGDTRLCLHGETADGTLIEGCDAIDTLLPQRRGR